MPKKPNAVVFDLGGVLIDWNPRYLYRQMFDGDETAMERFLAEVCTQDWNARMDAGRPFDEATEELVREFPEQAELIRAFRGRWEEMLGGVFDETLGIVEELKASGTRVYALSNWSAETFTYTRGRFPFLDEMDGVLISGEIKAIKPDPWVFREFLRRFGLAPGEVVFVDDSPANVGAARELGITSIQFEEAAQARRELKQLGFPLA